MPEFEVIMTKTWTVTVEADTPEEAESIARNDAYASLDGSEELDWTSETADFYVQPLDDFEEGDVGPEPYDVEGDR